MNDDWQGGRRLEMPMFTGENPDGLIFKAERYFNINHLTENERLVAAGINVDGDALSWL